MLIPIVLVSLAMVSDPEGVVSTAPRGPDAVIVGAVAPTTEARPDASLIMPTTQSLTTAEQIDRWVGARSETEKQFADDRGPRDDREMHGYVSGAIGTGDFSAVAVGVSLPIGETGRLNLRFSKSENGYGGYGYPYASPYGYGRSAYGYGAYDPTDFYTRSNDPFFEERISVAGSELVQRRPWPGARSSGTVED